MTLQQPRWCWCIFLRFVLVLKLQVATVVEARSTIVDPNATVSFFFTADPQFGWGTSYSGNEERALRTMIDMGRITEKCLDCPQVIPIAGDLTMNGDNRHIYRLGYMGAQSYGVKILDGLGNHDILPFADDEVSFDSTENLQFGQSLRDKGWRVVDTWTTVMSYDNLCGFYCDHPDAHYYTIGITNRNVDRVFVPCCSF